jgi:hypothetical protein
VSRQDCAFGYWVAAQEISQVHRWFACALKTYGPDRAGSASNGEFVIKNLARL